MYFDPLESLFVSCAPPTDPSRHAISIVARKNARRFIVDGRPLTMGICITALNSLQAQPEKTPTLAPPMSHNCNDSASIITLIVSTLRPQEVEAFFQIWSG